MAWILRARLWIMSQQLMEISCSRAVPRTPLQYLCLDLGVILGSVTQPEPQHWGRTAWSADGLRASRRSCSNIHFTQPAPNAAVSAPQRAGAELQLGKRPPCYNLGSPAGPMDTACPVRGAAHVRRQRWGRERRETERGRFPTPLPASGPRAAGRSMGKAPRWYFLLAARSRSRSRGAASSGGAGTSSHDTATCCSASPWGEEPPVTPFTPEVTPANGTACKCLHPQPLSVHSHLFTRPLPP